MPVVVETVGLGEVAGPTAELLVLVVTSTGPTAEETVGLPPVEEVEEDAAGLLMLVPVLALDDGEVGATAGMLLLPVTVEVTVEVAVDGVLGPPVEAVLVPPTDDWTTGEEDVGMVVAAVLWPVRVTVEVVFPGVTVTVTVTVTGELVAVTVTVCLGTTVEVEVITLDVTVEYAVDRAVEVMVEYFVLVDRAVEVTVLVEMDVTVRGCWHTWVELSAARGSTMRACTEERERSVARPATRTEERDILL